MNVGYEPIVFEVTGGLALEGQHHLQMICEAIDTKQGLQKGRTQRTLRIRISIDLQRGLHLTFQKQRRACLQICGGSPACEIHDRIYGS